MPPMNVSVFTIGRFHHYDLSRQILRLGHHLRLFTSNPRVKVDEGLWPYTQTHPLYRVPFAIGNRLGLGAHLYWLDEALLKDLARWLTRSLDPNWTEIFHALDGVGPQPGRKIKAAGKLWICDRGNSHITAQKQLLDDEYALWNVPPPKFSPHRLARCAAEYEEAHAVTVPSQFARRTFLQQGIPDERIFVCPYGVNLSEFRPAPKRDQIFRVLHVGQITVRKGIGHLLQAVEPLIRKGPLPRQVKVELWLIGETDSSVTRLLRQYSGIFELKGIIPRKDLWKYYSQASVLVLASIEDGFGLVLAQAMACGLPIISTTNTGADDLITNGVQGFIVPIRSPESIREKIQWMLDNPAQRDQMAAAALERVKTLGGWDRYGDAVQSVYNQLAARHNTSHHVTQ